MAVASVAMLRTDVSSELNGVHWAETVRQGSENAIRGMRRNAFMGVKGCAKIGVCPECRGTPALPFVPFRPVGAYLRADASRPHTALPGGLPGPAVAYGGGAPGA